MKIYIFCDMEGISGISGSEFLGPEKIYYTRGCEYMTEDSSACVRGCFNAGATEVIVRDGHSCGKHIIFDRLDPRAELIQGPDVPSRFPCLEGSSAIILLGYHAMAGTMRGLLEHSYCSSAFQNMWLNDRPVGEIGIDSAIASDYGVPVIMVSGDDKACAEAAGWIPNVVTCQVKQGLGTQSAKMLPLQKARNLIEEKAAEAIGKIGSIKPITVQKPVRIKREGISRFPLVQPGSRPGLKIIDARTVESEADTAETAFAQLA